MISRYASLAILLALLSGCTVSSPAPDPADEVAAPIAFDAALWQAARETLDFLPLEKTDPISGTIETGWGSPRGVFTTRYKVTAHLTYGRAYAQAAQILVQCQIDTDHGWQDVMADPKVAENLAWDIARAAQELRRAQRTGN